MTDISIEAMYILFVFSFVNISFFAFIHSVFTALLHFSDWLGAKIGIKISDLKTARTKESKENP